MLLKKTVVETPNAVKPDFDSMISKAHFNMPEFRRGFCTGNWVSMMRLMDKLWQVSPGHSRKFFALMILLKTKPKTIVLTERLAEMSIESAIKVIDERLNSYKPEDIVKVMDSIDALISNQMQ